jgi:hypothetical protein
MGSGFDNWVYWHLFTITVDYNSSQIELLLNDVCLANLSEESLQLPESWTGLFSLEFKIKVKLTLRLAVYRQSVRLGVRPPETHDQRFFSN